jgi:DNA-binding transcriptional MerR regulator
MKINREKIFTVPELAKDLGITERAIRFYESKGLISPKRAGNTRIFSYGDRTRLTIIMRSKKVGFSLKEIKDFLDLYAVNSNHKQQAKNGLDIVEKRMNSLKEQYKEIDIMLNDLKGIKNELSRVVKHGRK